MTDLPTQVDTQGFCSNEFSQFQDLFEQNFADGNEIGASLCLTFDGETIVDLWGGYRDLEQTLPWEEDTIACCFSSSKIPTILCVLILLDRGLLQLNEPIATYWPEFGMQGKDKLTVKHALTHRTLVPGLKNSQPESAQRDWDRITALIAQEKPWFDEDTMCYSPVLFGFILGELVQRVSGKNFRDFLNEELIEPLGADFKMGLTDKSELKRVAELLHQQPLPLEKDTLEREIFSSFFADSADSWDSWPMQSSVSPGASGFTNARGLCKFATMLAADGQIRSKQILSSEMVRTARTEQAHSIDPMLGELRLGLGFGLDGSNFPAPTPEAFHWGGYGGSWCFMDTTRRLAGAYVMNHCIVPGDMTDLWDMRLKRNFDLVRSTFAA
jgi:CubicO group peptidase (beta-lactamase class C family)